MNIQQVIIQWIPKPGGPLAWTTLELNAPGAPRRKASLWTKVTGKTAMHEMKEKNFGRNRWCSGKVRGSVTAPAALGVPGTKLGSRKRR